MRKKPTKMTFESIDQRNKQLRMFAPNMYRIDKKDPLVVWIYY